MTIPSAGEGFEAAQGSLAHCADLLDWYRDKYDDYGAPRVADPRVPWDMHGTILEGIENACMDLANEA